MNQLHSTNRLLKLADYLEQLPRGAIKMDAWLSDMKQPSYDQDATTLKRLNGLAEVNRGKVTVKAAPVEEVRGCGYAACAVGWAATIPEFRKAGLKLEAHKPRYEDEVLEMWPVYRSDRGFEAVCNFFGIDEFTADHLFGGDSFGDSARPRPSTVARRIRQVVDRIRAGRDPIWGD